MPEGKPKLKSIIGVISLVLFLLMIGNYIWVTIDVTAKESQPQYQGESAWGPALEYLFTQLFVWIPLLIASFITGVIAIVNNRGRIQGIIALSAMVIFYLWKALSNILSF
jgi:hypothetical protein